MLALSLAMPILLTVAPEEAHAAVGRGVVDYRLDEPSVELSVIPGIVDEMGAGKLGAKWSRVTVHWATLQPFAPGTTADADGYDDAYLQRLDAVVAALHAKGIRVIMTPIDVPRWASDTRYWGDDGYDADVVMRIGDATVRTAFQGLARFLASRYAGQADYFEVWNEPNLGSGIYPQLVGKSKKAVGPGVYVKMLKAFYAGAKKGNRRAVVIAGATSRRGSNNEHSTTPQWFARYLKQKHADKWFNAYSHHPYTPPNSSPMPSKPPKAPRKAVTLGNLDVLLDVFPKKPFYITEFGYSTGTVDWFCVRVSRADQARYLRQAYALLARRPQVKALLWFLVSDYQPDPEAPELGIYSGLMETDRLTRKPAWYAFAGHNTITAGAPASVPASGAFTISGTLTTRLGSLSGVALTLQSRLPSARSWKKAAATTTSSAGGYSFSVTQRSTRLYRVIWNGVCESRSVKVRTR